MRRRFSIRRRQPQEPTADWPLRHRPAIAKVFSIRIGGQRQGPPPAIER
jgi:hypothetical protein